MHPMHALRQDVPGAGSGGRGLPAGSHGQEELHRSERRALQPGHLPLRHLHQGLPGGRGQKAVRTRGCFYLLSKGPVP